MRSALASLLRSMGWFPDLEVEPLSDTVARVQHPLQLCLTDHSHTLYVATLATQVMGYIAVHGLPTLFLLAPEGDVSDLFVDVAQSRQGIGTQILHAVSQEAIQRGCSRLMLLNSRQRPSSPSGFYAQRG